MGRGKWTRWGRGSCEEWSLDVGVLIVAQVVRGIQLPPLWRATLNRAELGDHPTREAAIARIEEQLPDMWRQAAEDWAAYMVGADRGRK